MVSNECCHLRQMVDEEVTSLRAFLLRSLWHTTKHRAVWIGRVTLETGRVCPYGAGGREEGGTEGEGRREGGTEGGRGKDDTCVEESEGLCQWMVGH